MKLDEASTAQLKLWTIAKLEHLSEVDEDVLADYIIALLATDEPAPVARAACVDNLRDFLHDHAVQFVDDLFAALHSRAYDPSRPAPPPPPPPAAADLSKKRRHPDPDHQPQQHPFQQHNHASDRPAKQARRGARGGARGGRGTFPVPPTPPPGMPPFDPADPMAAFMAMAAAMGMMSATPAHFFPRDRCRDFDIKGFCTRGAQCPFEHGSDAYVVPDGDGQGTTPAATKGRSGPKRADFSLQGPNYNQSITSIVVEHIPKDKCNEPAVRDFFAAFGTIESISIMPHSRLAIVKYDNYKSANAAYNSPKSVFDNRFVKVYWYRPSEFEQPSHDSHGDVLMHEQEQEPDFDIEEVRKRQEEAQRRHEEKQRLIEQARQSSLAIDAALKQLTEKQREVADDLARKQGRPVPSEKTRHMREQLAKLEEEARMLGIDPDAVTIEQDWSTPYYQPRGRGRGGYRSRGRGRGRGSYRGWAGAAKGGAVRRLDNRPKTVLVAFTEGTYEEHQEALRSWLLFNSAEHASLDKHPEQDAALVTFDERYQGEIFMAATCTTDFPLHGKIELSWYAGAPVTHGLHTNTKFEESESMAEAHQEHHVMAPEDYDVALEDDRWG